MFSWQEQCASHDGGLDWRSAAVGFLECCTTGEYSGLPAEGVSNAAPTSKLSWYGQSRLTHQTQVLRTQKVLNVQRGSFRP